MKQYYLAIDLGASGGRHILAHMEDGRMVLEEIWRFENGMKKRNGHLCWDLQALMTNILLGLKKCKALGKIPTSMGIDTWAVDFVLLDERDQLLGDAVGYRDGRTAGMDALVYEKIGEEALYERTGIQKQIFNTIYQLTALKEQEPKLLKRARTLLMIPEYFNFMLTGKKAAEYTNATTTQLVSPKTKDWDTKLIEMLGFDRALFQEIKTPGTLLGNFLPGIRDFVGFDCQVVLPATHDTASAVLSVPASSDDGIYISSGTWSLMGIEQMHADCSRESMAANFTNEGGYAYRFRYLKNIMGLWMIQSVRHELGDTYSFSELCNMAKECTDFPSRVDVNADCFLVPSSMLEAIKTYCTETNQPVPVTPGEVAAVIYHSLADCYKATVKTLEKITGRTFSCVHIVGGGSNADFLNELTAQAVGYPVYAGPAEATAIGNVTAQMLADHVFDDLVQARACIFDSFGVKTFKCKGEV